MEILLFISIGLIIFGLYKHINQNFTFHEPTYMNLPPIEPYTWSETITTIRKHPQRNRYKRPNFS